MSWPCGSSLNLLFIFDAVLSCRSDKNRWKIPTTTTTSATMTTATVTSKTKRVKTATSKLLT